MIGFSQTNDTPGTFTPKRQISRWLEPPPTNSDFCDAIDEIMKHEHEDVILLDDALSSAASLELDLDISDLLDTQSPTPSSTTVSRMSSSTPSTGYTQPLNIYGITSFPLNNSNTNSTSTTTTSAYSSLGISPKFTTLSINQQHQHPFSPPPQDSNGQPALVQRYIRSPVGGSTKTILHPPPYVQQQQQRERSVLGTSYPFELQVNSGASDVKRFRSASMNDGPTQQLQQQQCTQDPQLFDPYRLKSSAYINPPYFQSKNTSSTNTTTTTSSSSLSADVASNTTWPYGSPRPASNSFSEFQNQQQQAHRINTSLSSSYGGSPSSYSLHLRPQEQRRQSGFLPELNFQQQQQQQATAANQTNCTLYSLNQPTGAATPSPPPSSIPLSRKRSSLVGFPVEEIKDDPSSPSVTMEQHSEPDLWSDIEQNSPDPMQDIDDDEGDETSDDDTTTTTISAGGSMRRTTSALGANQPTPSSLFWQYNVQAKGPKTKRILYLKERDPHLFREFSDPVYQIKLTQMKGQTLNKLRKGDGNDVTPNPMKLYQLGKQIRDLSATVSGPGVSPSSVYHGIYHVDQQSAAQQQHANNNDTAEVKKEKNKIASRACRLRKKAQHEANKLKLHGLNEEHKTLIDLISSVKLVIVKRFHDGHLGSPSSSPTESLEAAFDQLITNRCNPAVAGNTDGFVQAVVNDMERLYATKQRSNSLNT